MGWTKFKWFFRCPMNEFRLEMRHTRLVTYFFFRNRLNKTTNMWKLLLVFPWLNTQIELFNAETRRLLAQYRFSTSSNRSQIVNEISIQFSVKQANEIQCIKFNRNILKSIIGWKLIHKARVLYSNFHILVSLARGEFGKKKLELVLEQTHKCFFAQKQIQSNHNRKLFFRFNFDNKLMRANCYTKVLIDWKCKWKYSPFECRSYDEMISLKH